MAVAFARRFEGTRGFDLDPGLTFECLTLSEGPPGIETQRHVDSVVMPLCRLIESHDNRASG